MSNFTKSFRNGKTFSAFCRHRYGASKMIWNTPELWKREGQWRILFDIDAADELFGDPENSENELVYDAEDELFDRVRQMEEMATYIHSGLGLDAYYEDRDAGYAY